MPFDFLSVIIKFAHCWWKSRTMWPDKTSAILFIHFIHKDKSDNIFSSRNRWELLQSHRLKFYENCIEIDIREIIDFLKTSCLYGSFTSRWYLISHIFSVNVLVVGRGIEILNNYPVCMMVTRKDGVLGWTCALFISGCGICTSRIVLWSNCHRRKSVHSQTSFISASVCLRNLAFSSLLMI